MIIRSEYFFNFFLIYFRRREDFVFNFKIKIYRLILKRFYFGFFWSRIKSDYFNYFLD